VASAQQEFAQHYPQGGWVEHDAEEIWAGVQASARAALARSGLAAAQIAAIGITNQRETTVIWDRATGRPIHRAIVWQDRRTADACRALEDLGHGPEIARRTGLVLDPYFSASKIAWLLDHVPGARKRAERGELAFGTIDCWLIWQLTGGAVHATDATNAARTSLYDIRRNVWCDELCGMFRVPPALLPEVRDCAADYGISTLLGAQVPIRGVAGDQQAATMGQACFAPGMVKATFGTGAFALMNTGAQMVESRNRLLATIAWRLGGETAYALEGSIFVAGAAVQWLRDGLGVIGSAGETGALAASADPGQEVILVPAFTGLGAPHWSAQARGALFGLTRATGPAELARAALESVGFQTADLLAAMQADWPATAETVLRVDGGLAASDWAMQFLADILGAPVERPALLETTALGAAWLAGMQAGLCPGPEEMRARWQAERRFVPVMAAAERNRRRSAWQRAVAATLSA